jgi:hypothetical protein
LEIAINGQNLSRTTKIIFQRTRRDGSSAQDCTHEGLGQA